MHKKKYTIYNLSYRLDAKMQDLICSFKGTHFDISDFGVKREEEARLLKKTSCTRYVLNTS